MIVASIRINPVELNTLRAAFDRAIGIEDYMKDSAQDFAFRIAQEAQQRSFAISSRISSSFYLEQESAADSFISVKVASSFEGYPSPGSRDLTGDASLAASRGWATFTHRYDLGYSGNPRAGSTPAYGFLTRPFERLSQQWADRVIRRALRAWVGRG